VALLGTTADKQCQNYKSTNLRKESFRLKKEVIMDYLKIFPWFLTSRAETKKENSLRELILRGNSNQLNLISQLGPPLLPQKELIAALFQLPY